MEGASKTALSALINSHDIVSRTLYNYKCPHQWSLKNCRHKFFITKSKLKSREGIFSYHLIFFANLRPVRKNQRFRQARLQCTLLFRIRHSEISAFFKKKSKQNTSRYQSPLCSPNSCNSIAKIDVKTFRTVSLN